MKLVLFGATGMVGMGALREALADPTVRSVLVVGRSSCGVQHDKLSELLLADLFDPSAVEDQLAGLDACLWAIGVTSVGKDEASYSKVTEELTLLWARLLLRLNPGLSFCYCCAAGADGPGMWPRVRRRVEQALKGMAFTHVGSVRPAAIRPGPGIRSRTRGYQLGIDLARPLFFFTPTLIRWMPSLLTTSEALGRAMLLVVQGRADRFILESSDINRLTA